MQLFIVISHAFPVFKYKLDWVPVSYTHLDVYKRQAYTRALDELFVYSDVIDVTGVQTCALPISEGESSDCRADCGGCVIYFIIKS